MTSAFDEIRYRLDMETVTAHYGIHAERGGMVRCPFHDDRNPSAKLYPDSLYCFACGRLFDAVALVCEIYGLKPIDAARKLSDDFRLDLFPDKPLSATERKHAKQMERERKRDAERVEAFDDWYWHVWRVLLWYKRILGELCATYVPKNIDDDIEDYAFLLHESTRIDGWIDCLDFGEYSEIVGFYNNHRKEIREIDKIRQSRCVANTTA